MDLREIDGKSIALLLVDETKEEADWFVLNGIARFSESAFYVELVTSQKPFEIQIEWLSRIKPTPKELRDVLSDADYYLPLVVGSLPDDADLNEYVHTGLKLPQ
ncbi:MAG: hypothetical protein ACREOI_04985 [bacterium]